MKRRNALLLAILLTSACSQQEAQNSREDSSGIAPSAAPGVAFRFSFDYSLEDRRISAVQEAHAAACESLGLNKCRITGLDYQVDDKERVSASLQVKLDPTLARQFGKRATATVTASEGKLVRSAFEGEDVGTQIGEGQSRKTDLEARIASLEQRLNSLAAGDREAAQIRGQIEELRTQLATIQGGIRSGQAQLASSPMTFNYYGEGGIAGFEENPIKASWRIMVESGVTMISIVLKVIGALLPWAILLLLVVAIIRSAVGRGAVRLWQRIAPKQVEEE